MRIGPDFESWNGRLEGERDVKTACSANDSGRAECKPQKTVKDIAAGTPLTDVSTLFQRNLRNSSAQSDYDKHRAALLAAERIGSWDRIATETATLAEREAAEIIWRIREHERDGLFGNKPGETIPGPDTLDMGGQLLTNHSRIERSELFRIARQAPKGCLLHIHFNTEIESREIIRRSRDLDTMYIRSTRALVIPQDYDDCEIVFSVLPASTASANIFTKDYDDLLSSGDENVWMRWKTFCKIFKEHRGEDADDWISSKIALGEEVYGPRQTLNGYEFPSPT